MLNYLTLKVLHILYLITYKYQGNIVSIAMPSRNITLINFVAPNKIKFVFMSFKDVLQSYWDSHECSSQNTVGMWSNKRDNDIRNHFKAMKVAVYPCKSSPIFSFLACKMALLILHNCQYLHEIHTHAIVLECGASAFVKCREQKSATGFQGLLKNTSIFLRRSLGELRGGCVRSRWRWKVRDNLGWCLSLRGSSKAKGTEKYDN